VLLNATSKIGGLMFIEYMFSSHVKLLLCQFLSF